MLGCSLLFEMLKEEERAKCTKESKQIRADIKGLNERYTEANVSIL